MKFATTILKIALCNTACGNALTEFINMYIGTSYWKNISDVHDYGNVMLSIGNPHAHTPWSPQTRSNENKCESPYYYFDSHWKGLRRTHFMSGSCVIDYGTASILPSLNVDLEKSFHFHSLQHDNEVVTPYYYGVNLAESGLYAEAASKNSAGIARFSVRDSVISYFYLIFLGSDTYYNESAVEISASNDTVLITSPVHRWYQSKGEKAGFSGHHYFKLSTPAIEVGIIEGYSGIVRHGARQGNSSITGPAAAYMKFQSAQTSEVIVFAGCSFLSVEKAHENLRSELSNKQSTQLDETLSHEENESDDNLLDIETLIMIGKREWDMKLAMIEVSDLVDVSKQSLQVSTIANDMPTEGPNQAQSFSLNQIRIDTDKSSSVFDDKVIFYTSLYHSLLLPRIINDFDGEFLNFDETKRTVERTSQRSRSFQFRNYYDDFSMWDVFRAQVPLFSIIMDNNQMRDIIASLVTKSQQGGWLPIFPAWNSYTDEMIGDHCSVFVADAILKGKIALNDELIQPAFNAVIKNALQIPNSTDYLMGKGRRAMQSYLQYGFIPIEDDVINSPHPFQQVSRTLEYAYDDFVASQLANFIGSHKCRLSAINVSADIARENRNYTQISKSLRVRSQNYRRVIDGEGVGFVRPRHKNNTWALSEGTFDPTKHYTWITETDVWQYTWFAPHDVEGLIGIYGGEEAFLSKLDQFFDDGRYNHGNEPDHHAAFLYAYTSQPWRTQLRVASVQRSQYKATERGLPGNEDAGQMSAWYVMTAIGLYQVCPGCGGSNEYVLGLPLFDLVRVRIPSPVSASRASAIPANTAETQVACAEDCLSAATMHIPSSGFGLTSVSSSIGSAASLTRDLQPTKTSSHSTSRRENTHQHKPPLFRELTMTVHGRYDRLADVFIQEVYLNGLFYDCGFVAHEALQQGGKWDFYAGRLPNVTRATTGRKCLGHAVR